MRRLFIAEKPSLARAIAAGLGNEKKNNGYISCGDDVVTWCFGHILTQFDAEDYDERLKKWNLDDLPFIPNEWKLKIAPKCKEQFGIIKKLTKEAEIIVNAGDPDREGQLLVDEVLEYIGVLDKKIIKRILLNALDDKSVKSALNNLKDNKEFLGLRLSALARSRADWLVGINLTRAFTLKARQAGHQNVFSVGRVQTPTLALVVHREEEIKNFKPGNYYKLIVDWSQQNGNIKTQWKPKDDSLLDSEGRLINKKAAEEVANKIRDKLGKITNVEEKKGSSQQRLPYSLSALQIHAGKLYSYSPQEVLDTCQELYEAKFTTYPRSDCDYLPENQLTDAGTILKNLSAISSLYNIVGKADTKIRSRAWNDKKISAHHAIIPTTVPVKFDGLTDKQKNIYLLIAKAYIAQFYPAQTFLTTKISIECAEENFTATGKVILENGWQEIYKAEKETPDTDEAAEENSSQKLPKVAVGEQVTHSKSNIADCVTKPPARFNPATLLKAMKEIYKYVKDPNLRATLKECSGIGTEATRATIIEKIQEKSFVKIQSKCFVPTEAAYALVHILPDTLTYPDMTAAWETNLEAISKNEMSLPAFTKQQTKFISELITEAKSSHIKPAKNTHLCPNCHKALVRRKGKKGYFWGCSGYPSCKSIFYDDNGKPKIK